MKVLITGTTGFIGSRLALKCAEEGHEVVALGQTNNAIEEGRRSLLDKAGVSVTQVPLADNAGLAEAVRGCDVVYHLAAAQHEANVADQYFRDINVEGTRNVFRAAQEAGVRRFVYGSTIGVYGAALNGRITEATEVRPSNIYEVTKLEGERVVLEANHGIEVSVIRISETYGPGDGRLLKLFKAIKKGSFFIIGNGRNLHQLIFVEDLLRALELAASHPRAVGQTLVVAGNEAFTTTEMCRQVAEAVGARMRGMRAPLWPFDVAATVLEAVCPPLGLQPPLHKRRLDFFRKSFVFDTRRAAEVLEFAPSTGFRDGARATAKWYFENGLL